MTGILAIFKAYPTLSDPGLFFTLLSLFPETFARTLYRYLSGRCLTPFTDLRYPIVTTLLQLHASLLLPLFNHLWLSQGTGNANFFYASTLVFGVANGAALLDCMWAGLRVAIGEPKEGYEVIQQ
jgi:GPI-anchor transamidase subunit U